jgi:hypothetical protein
VAGDDGNPVVIPRNDWRVVGDRRAGGEVAYGMKIGNDGRWVLQVTVPFSNADLDPGDAYRLATGILDQLAAAGWTER